MKVVFMIQYLVKVIEFNMIFSFIINSSFQSSVAVLFLSSETRIIDPKFKNLILIGITIAVLYFIEILNSLTMTTNELEQNEKNKETLYEQRITKSDKLKI